MNVLRVSAVQNPGAFTALALLRDEQKICVFIDTISVLGYGFVQLATG